MDKASVLHYNENTTGGEQMNKILAGIIFTMLATGCVANVTPEGTYLEPLPVVIGPPVVVEPSQHIYLRPLPPVVLEPERRVYFHNNMYYYYWGNSWYYGERERGPWHRLPEEYYPRKYKDRERDRERDRDRYRYRDGDYAPGERH
jgi:hypothetical protein